MTKLTDRQRKTIDRRILQDAVARASALSLFFALSFSIYGLSSYEFIHEIDHNVSLWDNVWPRLLFNGLPFLFFYFWFKQSQKRTALKMWLWTLGYPVIFLSACLIHVWPTMWADHSELYFYVHGANFLALIMAMGLVSPPPRFLWVMSVLTVLTFILPVSLIFVHLNEYSLLRFFLNDAAYAYFLGVMSAVTTFRLRYALAKENVLNQRKIEKFVGNLVSQSIFENNESLLRPRQAEAFVMFIDVRGFTGLMKGRAVEDASHFKENYHRLVARVVGEHGGFIHKTHGDGHLISLGLMSQDVDLSDVPDLETEISRAEMRKHQKRLMNAVATFDRIFEEFERLKLEMHINENVNVCASVDFGVIGLKILGDPNVRLEFDVEGLVVIRCARLEAYTKTLREEFSGESSFLVLSSTATEFLSDEEPFQIFSTEKKPLKDFPDEVSISFKEYKSKTQKKNNVA